MKENKKGLQIILVLIVMFLWGSLFPIIKLGYNEFSIDTTFVPNLIFFAGVRFVICGFIILIFQTCKDKKVPTVNTKREWIGVGLVGVFAVMCHYACTYIGLSLVDSSKTALLKQSGVLIFVCFSFVFIKEDKFTIGKLTGAIFGLVSVIVLDVNSVGIGFGVGESFIICASFCTVASNVCCKKMLKGTNPITITGYSEFIGGILLLAIGGITGGCLHTLTLRGALVFLYIIVATVISYSLWYSQVQDVDLSKLFIIKLSEPLFTAIISAVILKEQIFKWQYLVSIISVGIAMIVSNIKIKNKKEDVEINDVRKAG